MDFTEYKDKRVVVTGCSSGIGRATTAALLGYGAQVIGMSRRETDLPVDAFVQLDLASPDSIDAAAEAVGGDVDALFNCAGAPPLLPSIDLMRVNFLGPRMLTDRILESIGAGGAIASVASSNGSGWRRNLAMLQEFLAVTDYEGGAEWYAANEERAGHGYPFSKEATILWTLNSAEPLAGRGVRINCTSPGAVETPLLEATALALPAELLAAVERPSGRRSAVDEQVGPLLFLNSAAASYITGADLPTDGGNRATQAVTGSLW
ncbi:coniferyl-alcohol dehydrogenase [Demequina muriae]|uniref:Coniferyl-alcohol dehydrogenase n=1 Tax=Demequina muriae TaxID=3051664 RepID=A0ABT8GGB1_9MICO|nr:coniferyl-alcohol dehydrogenase [Demequina sp. EGI L300058]MDN4480460.1 coniferyl-alcohol dehydrogenase [Demequina sp. EGI L300058]